ncbi:ATP-dependent Clp protease proteolytic subunit [Candidatus Uhrbacteria bacterium]|nr:ATP-dependent Clp protease proteolytic subunit [Candidatus Uhrbacteria bacterium]
MSFTGEISEQRIELLLQELRRENGRTGLFVHSPGGTFDFFSRLGPAIARRDVTTFAGDVESAAVLLYLLGHRRIAHPRSTFLFHEVRIFPAGSMGGPITVTDLEGFEEYRSRMSREGREHYEAWLASMRDAQSWFVRFLRAQTNVDTGTFLGLMREEARLSAHEALRYGIVHNVTERFPWQPR